MPSLDILLAFAAATLVFAYMPGPAMLYTAAQTLARGRRGGLMAAFGIHCGGYAHVLAATLGLAALFQLVPALYMIVKLLGALYLIWLGIAMIRTRLDGAPLSVAGTNIAARAPWRAFADSVAVEILNPKAALFFVAFLPQFVDPQAVLPLWLQFLVLGTIVNIAFSSADLVAVMLAAALMTRLKRSNRAQRVLRWLGGSVLVGLGVHMAASRN
jgi:threonine/homoserine/homoserine lactone efflux protein